MIKLTKEITSKNIFEEFAGIEKNNINAKISNQENFSKSLLVYLKSYISSIDYNSLKEDSNAELEYIKNIAKFLKLSNENTYKLNNLISSLDEILNSSTLEKKEDFKNLEQELKKYNKKCIDTFEHISINNNSIEYFINKNCKDILVESQDQVKAEIEKSQKENQKENIQEIASKEIPSQVLNISYPEKTLIISDIDKKVYLPYTNNEIISMLNDPKFNFKNEQEIIDKYYTIPLENYRFPAISRFKEAYNIVTKKEKGSILQAIELGLELFSNYNLHPAIITACKNLNQLDIYLSCLEYNELDDFKFFKTEFKSAPSKIKNKLFNKA